MKKRLPWLEINLATAFLAAAVVGLFEGTIARFTALAVLLPVVAGQSGNTAAQALAVTMRGLAMREIRVSQWPRVLRKEATVALLNGIAVSLTTAAGVFVWSRSTGLAMIIGVSMAISMVAAGTAGVLVPTTLTKLGQDPAQSSSIILTTVRTSWASPASSESRRCFAVCCSPIPGADVRDTCTEPGVRAAIRASSMPAGTASR